MNFKQYFLESQDKYFYHGSPYEFNKFSLEKVGTGDGLKKYGFGLYFADNEKLAEYYANELSIGMNKKTGLNIYQVKLRELDNFYEWDMLVPESVYLDVAESLEEKGFEESANMMRDELEGYQETYTLDQLYSLVNSDISSEKETTELLYDIGVSGAISDDIQGRGKIYVAYSDEIIYIMNKWKVGKRYND